MGPGAGLAMIKCGVHPGWRAARRWAVEAAAQVLRRPDVAVFVGLCALAVAPLYAGRYLPFFDYPAHLSVAAALRLRADPASAVAELWSLQVRLAPNALHYLLTYLGSFVVSLEAASRLFVAVFCVGALPPAVAYLLRAFGRDWRLAVLAVPLAWNRCLWYGFIDFCAALPMSLVALGLLARQLVEPARRRTLALAALSAVLPFTHFFVMLVTVALAAVLAALFARAVPPKRLARAVAPLAIGPALMAPWFLSTLRHGPAHGPDGGGAVATIARLLAARPRMAEYAGLLRHWFLDAYFGWFDDAVALVVVLSLAALMLWSRREAPASPAAPPPAGPTRAVRVAPLGLAAAVALAYVALPFELRGPFDWWAMNVRVIPILFIWSLVSIAPGRLDRMGRLLLAPAVVASAAYLIFIAVDVRRTFNGPWGMGGLSDVLQRLPPGARVLGLYTDYRQPMHYAGYPFHYASSYAVVDHGGLATPRHSIPQAWTDLVTIPPHPTAGDAALFRFAAHAWPYTHVLVRTCRGQGCVPDPLEDRTEATRVAEAGRWRLYEVAKRP